MSDAIISADGETATMPLRRPITVHGKNGPEQIAVLNFKLPGGALMLQKGEPFTTKIEADSAGTTKIEFTINPVLAGAYLAEMTGHNAALLAQLHALDVRDAFDVLVKMLRPTPG